MSSGARHVLGPLADFPDEEATRVDLGGIPVAVVRIGSTVHAVNDTCSHANVSLSDGEVWCDELELECPQHGSAFSLRTGEPNTLPATRPVEVYEAAVVDGEVVVTIGGTS